MKLVSENWKCCGGGRREKSCRQQKKKEEKVFSDAVLRNWFRLFLGKTDFFSSGSSVKSVPWAMLFTHVSVNKKILRLVLCVESAFTSCKGQNSPTSRYQRAKSNQSQKEHSTCDNDSWTTQLFNSARFFFANQTKKYVTNRRKNTHIQSQAEFSGESRLVSSYWIVKIFESIDSQARYCCFANKWSIKSSIVCSVVSSARRALRLFPKLFVGRKTKSFGRDGEE